jgi:hypothetical protein
VFENGSIRKLSNNTFEKREHSHEPKLADPTQIFIDKRLLKRKHPTGDIDPNYSGSGSSERVVVIQ